jgi:hypothetical protein
VHTITQNIHVKIGQFTNLTNFRQPQPKIHVLLPTIPAAFASRRRSATECLKKDRDVLLTFYDFPAEHWKHLRTTNPIESTFATVRHRTIRSKG